MNKIIKTVLAFQVILYLCINSLNAQDANTIVTNAIDFLEIQIALDMAESNKKPDVINIGEGTISLKGLEQYFWYQPPHRPKPEMEEHYPLIINGAGPDKTIIDGAGGPIFMILTGSMSDDFGANITISNICFKNVTDGSALGIGTKKASIRIENCKFINCKGDKGSGLSATAAGEFSGSVYVRKCVVDSCKGAIFLSSSSTSTIEKCEFTNNTAYPALELSALYGALEVLENTFTNNSTTELSPVQCIIVGSGDIRVAKNIFSDNSGHTSGAIKIGAVNSKINLFRNEFHGNNGTESGAAYVSNNGEGKITISRNVFTGNRSTNYGGAAKIFSGVDINSEKDKKSNIVVKSCLFASNRSAFGSSLHIRSDMAAVDIHNCTFAMDSVSIRNGGVLSMCLCNNISSANLLNNLFFGNVTKNGSHWSHNNKEVVINNDCSDLRSIEPSDGIGAEVNFSHNILHSDSVYIKTTVSRSKNLNVDPLLDDSFRLTANSPGIDAGTPSAHPRLDPGKDCAGKDRSIDGDNDGTAVVDIGAFEFDPRIASMHKSKDKSNFSPGPEKRKAKGLWLINSKIIDYRKEVTSFFYP
jgi:parallel beta-helix repeat protein